MEVSSAGYVQWDAILELLRRIGEPDVEDPLATILKIMSDANIKLKAMLRQHALSSPVLRDPEVLERIKNSPIAISLGFDKDVELRQRNMEKRVR